MDNATCQNTDLRIWRKIQDPLSLSIHVTKGGNIGINVGGSVIVMPVEKWHALGMMEVGLEKAACDHAGYLALPEPRPRHCPTCGTCMWDAGD